MGDVVYYLVLVFSFGTIHQWPGGLGATTIPEPFQDKPACLRAAQEAKDDYTGTDYVNWTCVPVEEHLEPRP